VKVTVAEPKLVKVTVRLLVAPTGRLPGLAIVALTSTGWVPMLAVAVLLVVLLSGTELVPKLLVTVAPVLTTGTVTVNCAVAPGASVMVTVCVAVPLTLIVVV